MSKAAFISTMHGHNWGGSETLWSDAAGHFIKAGHQLILSVDQWENPAPRIRELVEQGATLVQTHVRYRAKMLLGRFYSDPTYKWLDESRPDLAVISLGLFSEGAEWMAACRQRNIPYVIIVQSLNEAHWMADSWADAYAEHLEKAKVVYFVSQGIRDTARRQLATPLENARIAYNPFKAPYDISLEWPKDQTKLRLACVARLELAPKGQDILFEVLAQENWLKRDLTVTLYGSGANKNLIHKMKDYYALTQVEFGGFVDDITEIWRTHHALIMPSRYEGMPLAQIEAMLCSRPCIVTDVPGNSELIQDGVTGFIAAGPKPALLSEAMERAWQSRDKLEAMGISAAESVRQIIPRDPSRVFAEDLSTLLS